MHFNFNIVITTHSRFSYYVRIQRGTPLKNHKNRVSWQYLSGSTENQIATKPAFNVGPSSVRQRNAIYMAVRWQADNGPHLVFFLSSLLSYPPPPKKKKKKKKKPSRVGSPLAKLFGTVHAYYFYHKMRIHKAFPSRGIEDHNYIKNQVLFSCVKHKHCRYFRFW